MKSDKRRSFFNIIKDIQASFISAIAGVVISIFASFWSFTEVAKTRPPVLWILIISIILIGLMAILTTFARRGPSRVSILKEAIIEAYITALDKSVFNPKPSEGGENA